MLAVGKKAPNFELFNEKNELKKLTDYAGRWLLIYFYPKDDTPGCTTEACTFRDNFPDFNKLPISIVGVSVDSVASHQKFLTKYKLPFTLLADVDKKMVESYGVWGKKKFMGRSYLGIMRSSYLINPEGIIVKVYEKVKPADHPGEVLADLTQFLKT